MCKNISVFGLLVIALACFGCSSSSKSVSSGDGSAPYGQDSAGFAGTGDVPASDMAGGVGSVDSAKPADGRANGDLGRSADSAVTSKDVGGQEIGTAVMDAPRLTGDAPYQLSDSRPYQDGSPVVDTPTAGTDLSGPIADALSARDASDDGTAGSVDLRKTDTYRMGTPVCDLGSTFKMPDTQSAVPDNYGVCMPPAGQSMADLSWYSGMPDGTSADISRDGLNTISKVVTCTELSDSGSSGGTAGPILKVVMAAQPASYPANTTRPQRVFAIYEDPSGAVARAAYDLNLLKPEYENRLPQYPERYLRLSPACDSVDEIPFLKGWTGRIGSLGPTRFRRPDNTIWSRWEVVLWGSAEGEIETKALWFTVERAP